MLIPPCRMQRKASAAVMTKGIMLPVWVSASTDSKSPVPIHATSRSVHSHSIGRADKEHELTVLNGEINVPQRLRMASGVFHFDILEKYHKSISASEPGISIPRSESSGIF